jgi:predicted metal-binding transcription factor (methanogenesis marker protein 9)
MENLVDFDQLIAKLQKNLKRAKSTGKREQLEDYIRKLEICQQISEKEMVTEEDVTKAMSVTCYQNIGYCCGLEKPCLWRDSCRQALGIDDEVYVEVKEAVVWEILQRLSKKETRT